MANLDPWGRLEQALAGGNDGEIRKAYEELYTSIRGEMVRFAGWCVQRHNPGLVPGWVLDPEEVVEDAFTELYLKCRRIKSGLKDWTLGTIRRKLKYDVAKSRREDKNKGHAQGLLNALRKRRRCRSSLTREQRLELRRRVNSLPPRMHAVIKALYFRDESIATTAALLGVTENTVVQTRRRAVKKLKGFLARRRDI